MNIYIPFTYYVYHIPTGKHYYGARWGKKSNPNTLWTKYFTSSRRVHKLIKDYGKDSFIVEIRRTFKTADECYKWETKVLRRLRVIDKDNWLNTHCNEKQCRNKGGYTVNRTAEHQAKLSQINGDRNRSRRGIQLPEAHRSNISKALKVAYKEGRRHPLSEETKAKISATALKNKALLKEQGLLVRKDTRISKASKDSPEYRAHQSLKIKAVWAARKAAKIDM